jgi:hypothetical protein
MLGLQEASLHDASIIPVPKRAYARIKPPFDIGLGLRRLS